jgi:hypothetical protein
MGVRSSNLFGRANEINNFSNFDLPKNSLWADQGQNFHRADRRAAGARLRLRYSPLSGNECLASARVSDPVGPTS